MIYTLELKFDHLLLQLPEGYWILDTGSPQSFGDQPNISIANNIFEISSNLMGLNAKVLSELSGISVLGLIGTDILNEFNILFDVQSRQVTFSDLPLNIDGKNIFMKDNKIRKNIKICIRIEN